MRSDNALYRLALRPFQSGRTDLATLAQFVDECVSRPPLDPLPESEMFLELLPEHVDWSKQPSLQFSTYLTFLTLLLAELWARNHLVSLVAARNLWEMAAQDPASASLTEILLPALERHPAYAHRPETKALIAGLGGLLTLVPQSRILSAETLERLDQGLAFPSSGFVRHQLPWLLWNHRGGSPLPTWEGLLERFQREPEKLQTALQAVYPRAFFALRYGSMARDQLESGSLKALETMDEGAREVLETPGLEYLSAAEQEELRAHSVRTREGVLGLLQSCIYLLNRANGLLQPADPWPLSYSIQIASAEVRLRGFHATGDQELLTAARAFTLRGAWSTRRHNPLLFNNARHLLAKIYRARRRPEQAQRLWQGILHHLDKFRDQAFFADVAAGCNAQLAQLALEQDQIQLAKGYSLASIGQAGRHLAGGTAEDHFNLDGWSANLLDTAIAACVADGDGAKALEIFERWYSAGSLSRHLGLSPGDATTLRKDLPVDACLVYLCVDQRGASVLLVTAEEKIECWRGELCWDDLKQAVGPWLKAIWQLRAASASQGLERLENFTKAMDYTLSELIQLLRPLAETLKERGVSQVVLIPGRGLGGLPLHAVALEEGRAGREYFGDAFDVLYAPNATVWQAAARAQTARRQEKGFAGFASADGGFSNELDRAATLWGSGQTPHRNASPSQFLQAAAKSAILHVSCHGWFQVVDQKDSRLEVDAGLNLGGGRLEWRNLLPRLRLPRARLVVLSACESLLLSHRDILNQQFGLPYAFLAAGAPLLLGTSWKVEANATTLLMTRFHQNLRRQFQPASQALAEAQRWLRRMNRARVRAALARDSGGREDGLWIPEGEHPYRHPYWWAGFRLIGADLREERSGSG